MNTAKDLRHRLNRIDGRGYKAYRDIEGGYKFDNFELFIHRVQSDPFAPPTLVRVIVPQSKACFPENTLLPRSREIALRDFITRQFCRAIKKLSKRNDRGAGNSGVITMDAPGQQILERTSVFIDEQRVEARFYIGLPAIGRKIASNVACIMLLSELPEIVQFSLFYENLDKKALFRHIEISEDTDFLRRQLEKLGLIAFVANGSVLPRASGIDQRPLEKEQVVPFESPHSLKTSIKLLNSGTITGMGIKKGVTLIVGGGYHGKTTLLKALETGVYNHIPGDGREFVVSDPGAVKIRAEDGRRIEKVDISPFIRNLPFGKSTRGFSTEDASGSTSQAANIIESLELGARVLLIDEDTSATNFMIRDQRMQELVAKEYEPITPFIDKVRKLYSQMDISTIIVIGGSGDYFDVADKVICMNEYKPYDFTDKAHKIAFEYITSRNIEGGSQFGDISRRSPDAGSLISGQGNRRLKITPKGKNYIGFGKSLVDLSSVEQVVDESQTRAIGEAIYYSSGYMDGKKTVGEIVTLVIVDIEKKGLDVLSKKPAGNFAAFRGIELGFAINRLRILTVKSKG